MSDIYYERINSITQKKWCNIYDYQNGPVKSLITPLDKKIIDDAIVGHKNRDIYDFMYHFDILRINEAIDLTNKFFDDLYNGIS